MMQNNTKKIIIKIIGILLVFLLNLDSNTFLESEEEFLSDKKNKNEIETWSDWFSKNQDYFFMGFVILVTIPLFYYLSNSGDNIPPPPVNVSNTDIILNQLEDIIKIKEINDEFLIVVTNKALTSKEIIIILKQMLIYKKSEAIIDPENVEKYTKLVLELIKHFKKK